MSKPMLKGIKITAGIALGIVAVGLIAALVHSRNSSRAPAGREVPVVRQATEKPAAAQPRPPAPTPPPEPDELLRSVADPAQAVAERTRAIQYLAAHAATPAGSKDERILPALCRALQDKHAAVRSEALNQLTRLKHPDAGETAVKWLAEDSANDRGLAIRCIKSLGRKDQIPALRKLLAADDADVRVEAMIALANWGDEESRPIFEAAAQEDSPRIRTTGEQALAKLDAWKRIRAKDKISSDHKH